MAPLPINIFLVDDDEDMYFLAKDLLADIEDRDFRVRWFSNYDEAKLHINPKQCDVCLIDHYLGAHTGLELIRELTQSGIEVPMILLTGRGDREIDLAAMEAGAVDYLPKDQMTGEVLDRVVRYAMRRKRDEVANKALERQLIQAQKLEALGQLAGGVAHDFNNLLAVIKGNSEILLESIPSEAPSREEVLEICQATDRAAELTRQLLAFSRKQVFQSQPLMLNDIASQSCKILKRLMGANIEMIVKLASDLGFIKADPTQMDQVIMNLAINARDAMPNGGKLIIETNNVNFEHDFPTDTVTVPAGEYVMLSVTDTGLGMPEEVKQHIFEPFFSTKEKKGTGLGLATVHGVMSQSGGYISVSTEVGKGTIFKTYFPVCAERPQAALKNEEKRPQLLGTETVLVADDEPAVRNLVVKTLKRFGYNVLQGENGVEALRVARDCAQQIHLLLTDVMMPKQGGVALAEELKRLNPNIRVIFLSGFSGDALLDRGRLASNIVLIPKPFSPALLVEKVRMVLDSDLKNRQDLPVLNAQQDAKPSV